MDNLNEKLLDFQVLQQTKWLRLSNQEVKNILQRLTTLDLQLEQRVLSASTALQNYRFKLIKKQVNNLIDAFYTQNVTPFMEDLFKETLETAYDIENELFRRAIPVVIETITPNIGVLLLAEKLTEYKSNFLDNVLTTLTGNEKRIVNDIIINGTLQGLTPSQIVQALRGAANVPSVSNRQTSKRALALYTRTLITDATNQARQTVWENNSDIISAVRWVSTLDTSTSTVCRGRDGRIGPVSLNVEFNPPKGARLLHPPMVRPAAHVACRSTTVAVVKKWDEFPEVSDKLDKQTRASMNGQVPAEETYYKWLERQPVEVQKQVLGKNRYRLWKSGQIKADQFHDPEGRLLTLAELRRQQPQVFEQLGIKGFKQPQRG